MTADMNWSLVLGPYELRSLAIDPRIGITGVRLIPPSQIVDALRTQARESLRQIDAAHSGGWFVPGMDEMYAGIESALDESRFAWLRRAMNSYIVLKCRELDREGKRSDIG